MSGLRDIIQANPAAWLAGGGFVVGALFGALVFRFNFCTMGALSDIANLGDWRRMRAWVMAAAVGLLGAQALDWAGVVPLARSMYLAPTLGWAGNLLGGLMFGFGMVMAGGCASRNLARAGGGDLRALMTLLVVGISAYAAIGGIVGPLRAALERTTALALPLPTQSLGDALARLAGSAPAGTRLAVGLVIGVVALAWCLKDREFRGSADHVLSGAGIGLLVVAGWALTGLAFDDLADRPVAPISLTYVRPTGDTIEWLARYTAAPVPGFGVASVLGALAGAAAAALAKGRFRLATFSDTSDTLRNLGGGVLMGVGGVLALGCTVGQAITGISTLALGSFLTFAAIVAGAIYGLKTLERWLMAEA